MKRIIIFCLVALAFSAFETGCVPPPPRNSPKPAPGGPPRPPGGPVAEFR